MCYFFFAVWIWRNHENDQKSDREIVLGKAPEEVPLDLREMEYTNNHILKAGVVPLLRRIDFC